MFAVCLLSVVVIVCLLFVVCCCASLVVCTLYWLHTPPQLNNIHHQSLPIIVPLSKMTPPRNRQQEKYGRLTTSIIPPIILTTTLIKILLIPSYKSTDFDVHRNWMAITHNLPINEWYFDSINGTTVHTLDYPPSFAFFEYFLSSNYITTRYLLMESGVGSDSVYRGFSGASLNNTCLALLGDHENDVGDDCVIFQRCTVIFFDVIFLIGSYMICRSFLFEKNNGDGSKDGKEGVEIMESCCTKSDQRSIVAFMLLITNSGLILLDHVHFQYNGMLLGILLGSLAMLLQSIKVQEQHERHQSNNSNTNKANRSMQKFDLFGAVLFALLLTFKHMYLTLSPFYFFYLLRRCCFTISETTKERKHVLKEQFSFTPLVCLGCTVLFVLIGPFVPFLRYGVKEQMSQIISRLFPWQRGLCHDYWAGNVWALYLGLEKMMKSVFWLLQKIQNNKTAASFFFRSTVSKFERIMVMMQPPFLTITPSIAALCLLIGLAPAIYCSWRIGSSTNNLKHRTRQEGLLHTTVFSSLSSFMLAYHVHEKAIMTAIIPLTVLSVTSRENARLFLRISSVGHFGLMPLLYRSNELLMKVFLHGSYFLWSLYLLECVHGTNHTFGDDKKDSKNSMSKNSSSNLLTTWDKVGLGVMALLLVFVEVIHPLELFEPISKLEFLPLMMTSLWCALVLVVCWIHCGVIMIRLTLSEKEIKSALSAET